MWCFYVVPGYLAIIEWQNDLGDVQACKDDIKDYISRDRRGISKISIITIGRSSQTSPSVLGLVSPDSVRESLIKL